ncbi:PFU-domain-containing protein [Ceraceosorus guamensis]|uniref:PFU-domain-containing protein n=1 Tax=Ceraceosorus guamensis TaxID=1522189 RepID=A0A316W073_9BASI|nr:PFU-domain-containing protein [Ceraceosorus guamensis]PWN43180.1 PFU-domain-containing protein [Ceraceosorus guamensis]
MSLGSSSSFKLSAQLGGHSGDVRAVAASSSTPIKLLSASRDGSARVWTQGSGGRFDGEPAVLTAHTGFVNSAAWLRTGSGLVALTGGQDGIINGHSSDPVSGEINNAPDYMLLGHLSNVCALNVWQAEKDEESYLVSGGWDLTARVWRDFKQAAILEGATQAVWAVQPIGPSHVLTASADKIIRLYALPGIAEDIDDPDKAPSIEPCATFVGHDDAVRALVSLDSNRFASAGNDGNINVYDLPAPLPGGKPLSKPISPVATLSGHTSFIYSLSKLPSAEILSSGEDRSVRVWQGTEAAQTITVPAISVWAVTALPNGDLACGSSDHVVRVFSRSSERQADAEAQQAYDSTIAGQALNKTQVGDVEKDSLPGSEALTTPGKKEGDVKMIKAGALVEAHQWTQGQWVKIGEVVGGVGSGTKKLHEGKEYDYVFDVDIADDAPPLKLPYNLTDNPFIAAQKFLERNELPMSYLDQVVKFIESNTEGKTLGQGASEYVDPYTGASRYQSNASGNAGASGPGGYTAGSNVDPFTRSETVSKPKTSILPQRAYLDFKNLNTSAVKSKITQLSDGLKDQGVTPELQTIAKLLDSLASSGSGSGPLDLGALEVLLQRWPSDSLLPVLDTYRAAVLRPITTPRETAAQIVLDAARWSEPWPSDAAQAKARDTNSMLALRAIANLWANATKEERDRLAGRVETVSMSSSLSTNTFPKLSKNARVAYATVALNYSVYLTSNLGSVAWAGALLDLLIDILSTESGEPEVAFRALVALGNLVSAPL